MIRTDRVIPHNFPELFYCGSAGKYYNPRHHCIDVPHHAGEGMGTVEEG